MARAISSFPVPVSPWMSTVESVGATRSTCSSTDSSAWLLPMIRSNRSSSERQSRVPSFSKVPTRSSCRPQSFSGSTLQRCSYALQQDFVVERLGQELDRTRSQRLHPHARVAVGGDEDGRHSDLL